MKLRTLLVALALLLCAASTHAVTEVTGTTPGGAAYRIAVPDGWQPGHPLVLVQHPYSHTRIDNPDLGPLLATQLAQGMAVAASGYRQGGWALFTALDDNAELLTEFETRFGVPGPLYTSGNAMGALIALKLAEDPRFRARTRGVLAQCPIVDGVRQWDRTFHVRLNYDAVCAGVSGGDLRQGAEPLPWALDLDDIPLGLEEFTDPAVISAMPAVTACTGLGLPVESRSEAQRIRLARLQSLTGSVPEQLLIANLAYATLGLGDLVRAPDKLAGANVFFNEVETPFGVEQFPYNSSLSGIRRVRGYDAFARQRFDVSSRLDDSATARIVAMHTNRDSLVSQGHIYSLFRRYLPSLGERVYTNVDDTATPGHCGFSGAETRAGWDALTASSVVTPTLSQHCQARVAAGEAGPCRFTPMLSGLDFSYQEQFNVPRLYDWGYPKTSSGVWFDPARDGEGIVIEELGAVVAGGHDPYGVTYGSRRHVLVSWYTFAPPGDPNPGPRWLVGVGNHTSQGVVVPSLTQARGARFGAAFNPDDVERADWGSLAIIVDPFHRMRVRYDGPEGWEGSERSMTMLARVDFEVAHPRGNFADPPPPPPRAGLESASGTYFNPARDGEGVQLQVLAGASTSTRRATVQFYTYDPEGEPLWLVGLADNIPASGGEATFAMTRANGTVFGDNFNPGDVTRTPWGTLTLTLAANSDPTATGFAGYSATAMRWNSADTAYGSGGYALTRITRPHMHAAHAPRP